MHSPWYGIIIGSYHLDTSRLSSNSIRSYTVGLVENWLRGNSPLYRVEIIEKDTDHYLVSNPPLLIRE